MTHSSFAILISSLRRFLGILVAALVFPSCLPLDPSGKSAALESRVAALEEKLTASRKQQDSTSLLAPRLNDLEQRIEEAEQSRNKERTKIQTREQELQSQLLWMQRLFNTLNDAIISGERACTLSVTDQSVFPTLTRYGTFLFKLTGCDKAGDGFDAHLLVTNVTTLRIIGFRLHGDFGRKAPTFPAQANIRQRMETLDGWELGLTKFEQKFETVLEPGERTPLVLHLRAARLADLEFIRLWLDVQAVGLPATRPTDSFAVFDASRPDPDMLRVLPSDAGTFYLRIEKVTPVAGGQQLAVRFGNPLGMTIDKIRLRGTLGRKPPQPGQSDSPEKRELAQLQWRQSRKAYSKEIRATIKPMQWTQLTVELPAPSPGDLEYVECRVDIQEVHLLPGK